MRSRWWCSLVVILGYLVVFHLWTLLSPRGVMVSTVIAVAILGGVIAQAARSGYFVNRWDAAGHGCVLLDIALEGLLIPWHSGLGFYLCAAAFAVVVGGYRAWQLGRLAAT